MEEGETGVEQQMTTLLEHFASSSPFSPSSSCLPFQWFCEVMKVFLKEAVEIPPPTTTDNNSPSDNLKTVLTNFKQFSLECNLREKNGPENPQNDVKITVCQVILCDSSFFLFFFLAFFLSPS